MALRDKNFENLLPPLILLNSKEKEELINKLNSLNLQSITIKLLKNDISKSIIKNL